MLQLKAICRDSNRSGQTGKSPSNKLQRLQVVMSIASRNVHLLNTFGKTVIMSTHTTQVSINAVLNANASTKPSKLTGEVSNTRRLLKKSMENQLPNSLRKNVPNWLILSKLMKNLMDLSENSIFHIIS